MCSGELGRSDELAPKLLKVYSFREKGEIEEIIEVWESEKHKRVVQKELALEVTEIVRGKDKAKQAKKISEVLYYKGKEKLESEDFELLGKALGVVKVESREPEMVEVLVEAELASSKTEARRLIKQGAVEKKWYTDEFGLVKKGKKEYGLVRLEG